MTILLTNRDPAVWGALRDDALRKEYQAAIGKPKLFPVTFSLLGSAEPDAKDSLVRRFEREIRTRFPRTFVPRSRCSPRNWRSSGSRTRLAS